MLTFDWTRKGEQVIIRAQSFCRMHQTSGVTPAIGAGISDDGGTIDEVVAMMEAQRKGAA